MVNDSQRLSICCHTSSGKRPSLVIAVGFVELIAFREVPLVLSFGLMTGGVLPEQGASCSLRFSLLRAVLRCLNIAAWVDTIEQGISAS